MCLLPTDIRGAVGSGQFCTATRAVGVPDLELGDRAGIYARISSDRELNDA